MAKLRKIGKAMVVTSALKEEEIKKVAKFAPTSLQLMEDKTVKFRVMAGTSNSINNVGVCFSEKNADGYAQLTKMIDLDKKEDITEEYGVALANLNKVEEQVKHALEEVNGVFAGVQDSIVVE